MAEPHLGEYNTDGTPHWAFNIMAELKWGGILHEESDFGSIAYGGNTGWRALCHGHGCEHFHTAEPPIGRVLHCGTAVCRLPTRPNHSLGLQPRGTSLSVYTWAQPHPWCILRRGFQVFNTALLQPGGFGSKRTHPWGFNTAEPLLGGLSTLIIFNTVSGGFPHT